MDSITKRKTGQKGRRGRGGSKALHPQNIQNGIFFFFFHKFSFLFLFFFEF